MKRLVRMSRLQFEDLDEMRDAMAGKKVEGTVTEVINDAVRRESNAEWAVVSYVFRAHHMPITQACFAPVAVESPKYLVVVAPDDPDEDVVDPVLTIVRTSDVYQRRPPGEDAPHRKLHIDLCLLARELRDAIHDLGRATAEHQSMPGGEEAKEFEERVVIPADLRYTVAREKFIALLRRHDLAGVVYDGLFLGDKAGDAYDRCKTDLDMLAAYRLNSGRIVNLDLPREDEG